MNSIGEKLKLLRKEKGMTQTEFGETMGFTKQAVSNVENNLSNPSIDFLSKLILCFGINSNWLIADIGQPYNIDCGKNSKRASILKEIDKILKKQGV